jgi:predicted RNA polymerase sigma factor
MTAVSLARAYQVHESTMSRRLAKARAAVVEHLEQIVNRGTTDSETLTHLLAAAQSGLDLSLHDLLRTLEQGRS